MDGGVEPSVKARLDAALPPKGTYRRLTVEDLENGNQGTRTLVDILNGMSAVVWIAGSRSPSTKQQGNLKATGAKIFFLRIAKSPGEATKPPINWIPVDLRENDDLKVAIESLPLTSSVHPPADNPENYGGPRTVLRVHGAPSGTGKHWTWSYRDARGQELGGAEGPAPRPGGDPFSTLFPSGVLERTLLPSLTPPSAGRLATEASTAVGLEIEIGPDQVPLLALSWERLKDRSTAGQRLWCVEFRHLNSPRVEPVAIRRPLPIEFVGSPRPGYRTDRVQRKLERSGESERRRPSQRAARPADLVDSPRVFGDILVVMAPVRMGSGSQRDLEFSFLDAGREIWQSLRDLPPNSKLCLVFGFGPAEILRVPPPPGKNVVLVRLASDTETHRELLDEAVGKVEAFVADLVKVPASDLDLHRLTKDFADVRIWRSGPVRVEDPPVGRPSVPPAYALLDRIDQREAAERDCAELFQSNDGGVICALVPGRVPSEVRLIGEHIREYLVRKFETALVGYASVHEVARRPIAASELKQRIIHELKVLNPDSRAGGDWESLVRHAVGARSRQRAILILDWLDFPRVEFATPEWVDQARELEASVRSVFEDSPLSNGTILLNVIGLQLQNGDLNELREVLSRQSEDAPLAHYLSAVYLMMQNPTREHIRSCLRELDALLRGPKGKPSTVLGDLATKILERHGGVFHATAKEIDRCAEEGWDLAVRRLTPEDSEKQS